MGLRDLLWWNGTRFCALARIGGAIQPRLAVAYKLRSR
jgi:hypothetical protein